MNNSTFPSCPHCGLRQLVSSNSPRKIYIDHQGERIPLLTVNFRLDRPVLEETAVTYSCTCSWSGPANPT